MCLQLNKSTLIHRVIQHVQNKYTFYVLTIPMTGKSHKAKGFAQENITNAPTLPLHGHEYRTCTTCSTHFDPIDKRAVEAASDGLFLSNEHMCRKHVHSKFCVKFTIAPTRWLNNKNLKDNIRSWVETLCFEKRRPMKKLGMLDLLLFVGFRWLHRIFRKMFREHINLSPRHLETGECSSPVARYCALYSVQAKMVGEGRSANYYIV